MSSRKILNLPKHKNPGPNRPNRTASAPYNFVPLPEVVVTAVDNADDLPDHDLYYTNRHTGYFDVTLTTRSPLYVRCPFTQDEFDLDEQGKDRNGREVDNQTRYSARIKNTPHFFYTQNPNEPVIPGSSLRGMLRNVFEIVSYGKVQWVTHRRLIYRAVGDPSSLGNHYREQVLGPNKTSNPNMHFDYPSLRLKGGYLRRIGAQWMIQPATEICGESFVHVEYDQANSIIGGRGRQRVHDVYVQPIGRSPSSRGRRGPGNLSLDLAVTPKISATPGSNLVPAKLIESGHMGGRHPKHWHCAIYEPDPSKPCVPIPDDIWEVYQEDRDLTRGFPTRPLAHDGDPLFYLLDANDNLVFFGPTMMFRLPYRRSIVHLIPEPLRQPLTVDYADAVFGFVRRKDDFPSGELPPQGNKARAYAGRVFVTDAVLVEGKTDYWLSNRPITPKILATPKPTAFQHYLTQQEPDNRNELDHYDSPPPHETTIRGHKRYWHQGLNPSKGLTLDQIREHIEEERWRLTQLATSTQHTQFKPIKPGVKFRFRIYFENLSDRELGALCWTLHPFGEPEKDYCHHLGMGKPLGMGAVKLDATLHLTNRPTRYGSLFNGDNYQTGAIGNGEPLSDRVTLERRIQAFEQHILDALKLNTTCQHLFQLKRIAMLLKMMEWPGFRAVPPVHGQAAPNNCFITESGRQRPNTRYMMIELPGVDQTQEKNEYRNRPVLPDPCAFDPNLSRLAEPKPD
jgi:CRISPR-associated protein (TIGR03986 family)